MLTLREPQWTESRRGSRSEVATVVCLNRRQRRERAKKPYKYNRWVPKTEYLPVGKDGDHGRRADLVSKTTGLTTGMAVTWLGTSSGAPTPYRNVSSILLRLPGTTYVFDAGEGTQTQLLKADVFPSSVKKIFVTHLHGDHCFGLPGLLSLINQVRLFHGRGELLDVFGPPGLGELMRMSLPHWFDRFRMPISIVEFSVDPSVDTSPQSLDPNGHVTVRQMPPTRVSNPRAVGASAPTSSYGTELRQAMEKGSLWDIDAGDGITVTAAQLQHRVPCWGYVVQEADELPAQWEIDLWRKQQESSDIRSLDDVTACDQLSRRGRKVVILGDTCNSEAILSVGEGADLLSHEATFSNQMTEKALKAQHSTAAMAGRFAKRLNAQQLILTHFSARYRASGGAPDEGDNESDVKMLVSEARRAFGKNAVEAAKDFMTWHIPYHTASVQQV